LCVIPLVEILITHKSKEKLEGNMTTGPGRYIVQQGDAPPVEEYHHRDDKDSKFSATFLIILVSLLFVAVFGGALVGGVVSGDPSNGFFITIIVASAVAIGVATIVALRYWCKQRAARERSNVVTKPTRNHDGVGDIQGTITRTADEDEEAGYYDNRGRFYPKQGPVEEDIQEVEAPNMAPGDVSAMSPGTYDYESHAQTRSQFTRSEYNGNGYRLNINQRENEEYRPSSFDFESITSKRSTPVREDPPEDPVGANMYSGMPMSKDPSAAIATADGNMLDDEASDYDLNSPAAMSQTSRSVTSRYDVEGDDESAMVEASKKKKRERSKSPSKDRKHKVRTRAIVFTNVCDSSTYQLFIFFDRTLWLLLLHRPGQRDLEEVRRQRARLAALSAASSSNLLPVCSARKRLHQKRDIVT
jgi:hypothetical protein